MTTFSTGDRGRIVDALNLDESQNRTNSVLESLMTNRENDDVNYGVDRVGQIIAALDNIDDLDCDLEDSSSSPSIKRKNIYQQIEVEYATSDPSSGLKQSKMTEVNKIKRWLDPDDRLEAYNLDGRVIRTL